MEASMEASMEAILKAVQKDGPDPEENMKLAYVLRKARKAGMPNAMIDRVISMAATQAPAPAIVALDRSLETAPAVVQPAVSAAAPEAGLLLIGATLMLLLTGATLPLVTALRKEPALLLPA